MCGRVTVKTTLEGLMQAFSQVQRGDIETLANTFPRWNGAPGLDYPLIVHRPGDPTPTFMRANWGFIPRWMKDSKGGYKPINAKAEGVATNGMFKSAYAQRRALMPVDGYFEWKAIKGQKAKQPYAIAMKDGRPFALAAIWEEWRNPETMEDFRTFAIVTCQPNDLMGTIHDRMPVILHEKDYRRWMSDLEPDPNDLLVPYPSELMTMWPIDSKVGSVRNNTPDILDSVDLPPEDLFE